MKEIGCNIAPAFQPGILKDPNSQEVSWSLENYWEELFRFWFNVDHQKIVFVKQSAFVQMKCNSSSIFNLNLTFNKIWSRIMHFLSSSNQIYEYFLDLVDRTQSLWDNTICSLPMTLAWLLAPSRDIHPYPIPSIPIILLDYSTMVLNPSQMAFLDTHVSLAPTHVSPQVGRSVTLSDFQSVSVSGRPTWKVEESGPQLFFNFGSG